MLYNITVYLHQRMLVKIPQERLVQYKHSTRLNGRPYSSWSDAPEPPPYAFCPVYYPQTGDDRGRIECCGAVVAQGG
jgi:hypothetical protein